MAALGFTPLPERKAWQALKRHHAEIAGVHLRELFAADTGRGDLDILGIQQRDPGSRLQDNRLGLLQQGVTGSAKGHGCRFVGQRIGFGVTVVRA